MTDNSTVAVLDFYRTYSSATFGVVVPRLGIAEKDDDPCVDAANPPFQTTWDPLDLFTKDGPNQFDEISFTDVFIYDIFVGTAKPLRTTWDPSSTSAQRRSRTLTTRILSHAISLTIPSTMTRATSR